MLSTFSLANLYTTCKENTLLIGALSAFCFKEKRDTNFTDEDCLSVGSPGFGRASEFCRLCKFVEVFPKALRVAPISKVFSTYPDSIGKVFSITLPLQRLPHPLLPCSGQLRSKSSCCQDPKNNSHLCGRTRQRNSTELYKHSRYKRLNSRTYIDKLLCLFSTVTFRNRHSYRNSYHGQKDNS